MRKAFHPTTYLPSMIGLLAIVAMPCAESVRAADDAKPVREIFVPFDDLNVLLEGDAQRVFMTREEYEDLIERAKQSPVEHAPHKAIVTSASYETTIANERASIRGDLSLEVLEDGLYAIPLSVSGVGIINATLDDEPASLGRDPKGQPILFVEGAGKKQLQLQLVTVLQTSAAQQSLNFSLPTPAATRLHVTVPGNVEVRSGAAVITRSVDQEANTTRFELLPSRGATSLVMSLNNRLLLQRRVVMARSVIVDEITQAYEKLHATVSLGVLHGAVDQFRFRVPAGFEITDVESPTLSRWQVEANDEGERILDVALREPTTGTVVLNLAATNSVVSMADWKMPRLEPLDVANHVAVVGVLVEERLAFESVAPDGLIPINNAVLRQALPESVFVAEPGAPQVRPIAAYYAPQADYELSARFTKPPARVDATTAMILTLGEKEQLARGTLTLLPTIEKLFSLDVTVPAGWQVNSIMNQDNVAVDFEWIGDDGEAGHLHIKLPSGVAPGSQATLTLEATSIPDGWLDEWTETPAAFPVFRVVTAASNSGAIAVQTQDDLTVRPDELTGLTPLAEAERASLGLAGSEGTLAYRISNLDYSASFVVQRTSPRITARSFNFLKIDPEGLTAHYELIFDIQQARARRLLLELPESTPATLSIRGLDSVQVKETSSEVVDGNRRWTALLANATRGQVRLVVDFEQPLPDDEPQDFVLPLVRAVDVVYQSAIVAVEGNPEFDIQIETAGRKIDVGELVDAEYQVGRRLLGAFGFINAPAVTLDVFRRPGYGLPAALTERAELVTLVSANGRSQTSARYLLRTKAAFLQVSLPTDAELWSASVDGKPAMPQRDGNDLVISLPPTTTHAVRDLQIVYETPVDPISFMSDVETAAPQLAVRTDAGDERYRVPTADVQWHLVLPEGHRVVRTGGTLFIDKQQLPREMKPRTSPALVTAAVLYQLTGGIKRGMRLGPYRRGSASDANVMMDWANPPQTVATPQVVDMEEAMESSDSTLETATPAEMDGAEMPPAMEPQAAAVDAPMSDEAAATAQPEPASAVTADSDGESSGESGGEQTADQAPERDKFWALEGVRSLQIGLDRDGRSQVTLRSMGVEPRLQATLIHHDRLSFLACAIGLLVIIIGLALTNGSARRKAQFVIAMLVLTLAAPLLIGIALDLELSMICEPAFYAAALLVPYFLLAALAKCIVSKVASVMNRRVAATTTAALLAALAFVSPTAAQQPAQGPALNAEQLLLLLQPGKPLVLPKDSVIIPYDPEDANGVENAEKVLVPYEEYTRLWNLAFPDKPVDVPKPPAPYAFAGASYTATLDGEEFLLVTGRMNLDIYADSRLEIPLSLDGVLERATLDGQPARLRMIYAAPNQANPQGQQAAAQPAAAQSLALLYVEETGRKELELAIRLPLQRSGGWRIVQGQLPAAPATALQLTVPQSQTEVRLAGTLDRSAYETTAENETIETALNAAGSFNLQWRPKVAAGQVDQSLTAKSVGILDVQEDGIRLTWQLRLETRHSQRETFSFVVPKDYLIERVVGDNVRGWNAQQNDDHQQVDITLLKASSGNELITIHLSRREVVGLDELTKFIAPSVIVPDAVLHQGHLAIRRGPLLDVRTPSASGLNLAEIPQETLNAVIATITEENPLPLRPLQTYRFASTQFSLEMTARAYQFRATATEMAAEQTLLRISEDETIVETRFNVNINNRALYQLELYLPDDYQLDEVLVPGLLDWAITAADDRRLLTVYLTDGALGNVALDLRGKLPRIAGEAVAVPRFELIGMGRQTGVIVAQVDPSMDVVEEGLSQAQVLPLDRVGGWLVAEQRALARSAISYRNSNFEATFRVTQRNPDVDAFSVTNVRVTPREIEETVLLRFTIADAGIREVSFLLPATMANSQISVPLLRQKTITPDEDDPQQVRIHVELQDEVIDDLIVLVRNTRSLDGGDYEAPLPTIEPGETQDRYVVFESAGRDEVVVIDSEGFVELNRLLEDQWEKLSAIFSGNITQAYAVRDDAENPRLALATRERAMVETAGARIGLAKTLLVVDANGAYRGAQEYQVDNKTEQFLEIELPEGAELWTVIVAGEAVKPTVVPNATNSRLVRVPLIKTQVGDLAYAVILKYGGDLGRIRSFETVQFPLVRAVNIGVEVSQVRLRLPETHWWNKHAFGGSMRYVEDQGELAVDEVSHLGKQLQDLLGVMSSNADSFAKLRAANNLKQLGLSFHNYHDSYRRFRNDRLDRELVSNSDVLQEAQRQVQLQESLIQTDDAVGNSIQLQQLYDSQTNNPSRNVVNTLDNNFDASQPTTTREAGKLSGFNESWFKQNRLGRAVDSKKAEQSSRVQSQPQKKAPVSGKPSQQLKEQFGELNKNKGFDSKAGEKSDASKDVQQLADRVDQLQRYQKQLEANNPAAMPPQGRTRTLNAPAPAGADAFGDFAGAMEGGQAVAGGLAGLAQQQRGGDNQPGQGMPPGPGGAGGMGGGGGGFGGGGLAGDNSGGMGMDGGSLVPVQAVATGLSSLDVNFPNRGREYLFTTPRGDIDITAQPVATDQINRGAGLLAIAAGLIALWIGWRIACVVVSRCRGKITAVSLILLGTASICSGLFWVLGVISITCGVWMLVRILLQRGTTAQATVSSA